MLQILLALGDGPFMGCQISCALLDLISQVGRDRFSPFQKGGLACFEPGELAHQPGALLLEECQVGLQVIEVLITNGLDLRCGSIQLAQASSLLFVGLLGSPILGG